MSIYTGSKCISCEKVFTENDDIVVCPECGTPYHRHCYSKEGRCINEELHNCHGSWVAENTRNDSAEENTAHFLWICSECGASNSSKYIRCQECGCYNTETLIEFLSKNNGNVPPKLMAELEGKYCGFNPETTVGDDVTIAEMSNFIGVNQNYYLPLFKQMYKKQRSVSMNVWGFIFPHYFFASRKMYVETAIVLLLWTLLSLPSEFEYLYDSGMVFNHTVSAIVESSFFAPVCQVCMVLVVVLRISMLLFSNRLYYNHCIRKIKDIKLKFKPPQTKNQIKQRGNKSLIPPICVAAIQIFISSLLSLFLFLGDFF